MLAGAVIPFAFLLAYELWAKSKNQIAADYIHYKRKASEPVSIAKDEEEDDTGETSESQNTFGLKVLARTMGVISLIFVGLAFLSEKALDVTLMMGIIIGLAAWLIYRKGRRLISA